MERVAHRVTCDLILVTWNHLPYTKQCVESILRSTSLPYRLIIVDNGSAQETLTFLDELEAHQTGRVVTVRNQQNLGWVRAVNEGLRHSQAPYVCLLNNDLIVTSGWLESMIAVAEADPFIGLVNPTYNRCGESFEAFYRSIPPHPLVGARYIELNECNGACFLIRRTVLEAIGTLDEAYGLGGLDDSDYSRRAVVAGFQCARAKDAYVFHWENVTVNSIPRYWSEERRRNERLFASRWGARRQLTMVVAERDEERLTQQLQEGLALGRLGLRIHIWALLPRHSPLHASNGRWQRGLVEHNNLKWTLSTYPHRALLDDLWIGWLSVRAAINGFGRRWKRPMHQIQAFIVPSPRARVWLTVFRWFHGSPIFRDVRSCPIIEREAQWMQPIGQRTMPPHNTGHG